MIKSQITTSDDISVAICTDEGRILTNDLPINFGDGIVFLPAKGSSTHSWNKNNESPSGEMADSDYQRRIKNIPIAQAATKRRHFRETDLWIGLVTGVNEEGIIATLSRRYQEFPMEEAIIPWDEIQEFDRDIAKEGATFLWKVGYLQNNGQQLSVSSLEFRRSPNYTARDLEQAANRAVEYASLFQDE